MFTGIIEHVGCVRQIQHSDTGTRLDVDLGPLADDAAPGDSISTNGVCLTITSLTGSVAHFDVSVETKRRTTLAGWQAERRVNLERALRVGDRLGGHFVSGHVDGVGRLVERHREGESERFTFVLPDDGGVAVIEKGSVAIDGISLTTWGCRGARFNVAVVPHTLQHTTLDGLRPGTPVNLEQDAIGRWVERLMTPSA